MHPERTIGIVIALPQEASMFPSHDAGTVVRVDARLLVCVGGVGAAHAQAAARRLLESGANALMSWGVAVALTPDLKAGRMLLPRAVVAADGIVFPVTGAWHEQFHDEAALDVRPLAEAVRLLATPHEKRALGQALQAVAADMESAAVARVAQQAAVPFLVVRAIADDCETPVPGWLLSCVSARGRLRTVHLFSQLLRHPRDVVAVARIARAFFCARSALRGFRVRHLQPAPA
jgi:adenosylhomocysteine nucleosidase